MPTTSNFGWTTPADTDLVKDGAAAIRTLGNGIDTSFLDLKGGTTDQVLAKNSNTDLDFKWVAQDDSNAIQNAIVDAKGDLISATAADTPARLAVGANDTVLTADSATATGLKWATPSSGYTLINTGGTTLSGATVTISSIPATYTDLYILAINFKPATDNTDLVFYVNGDSGTKYVRAGVGNDSGTSSFGDTNVNLATGQDNGTDNGQASVMIRGYTLSTWKMFFANSITNDSATATNVRWATNIGATNITAAISSITFLASSGNMTSGTVYVYGVK